MLDPRVLTLGRPRPRVGLRLGDAQREPRWRRPRS